MLFAVAPLQVRRTVFIPRTLRFAALSVIGPGVGVGVGVAVGVGVGVGAPAPCRKMPPAPADQPYSSLTKASAVKESYGPTSGVCSIQVAPPLVVYLT